MAAGGRAGHRLPAGTEGARRQISGAGYGAVWHGQKSWNGVAILARGAEPVETHRGLPGDPDDTHSRYIEAAIGGLIVGCLYLPNGNPAPGPKFVASDDVAARTTTLPVMWAVNSPLRPRKPMMSVDPAIKLRTNGRARPAISAAADVPDHLRSIDGFAKTSFTEIAQ
jgi:hypothetical protein